MKKKHLWWSFIIWSFILIISFIWNYYLVESSNSKLVLNKSRAFFEQILITRAWSAEHGGVYVPITPTTQPNQYLEDSLRDVVTTNGLRLTKINPAYMTRQIAETNELKNDLQFHITSLNPIRPANKADAWETKSLKMFEKGVFENIELITDDSASQYRYMAPLITEKSCLKCHSKQGYKYGDIRGGISISFPNKEFTDSVNKQIFSLGFIHLIILILGMIGLWVYYRMANKYLLIIESRNNELAQINATKDRFFSIIGHDLKAPFNSILGFSEILIEQINNKNDDSIEKYAKIIHDSSERAFLLLGNLLEWSQTQTGKMQFNPKSFNLITEVNAVKELLNEMALQKSITIEIEIQENLMVFADKEMINTVLRNLVSNAIKFTQTSGRITISAKKIKNDLIVNITDNGIGMPKEHIVKLFTVSDNYSTPGTQNEKGTGLGLILCKEFVEKNNGKIWVESIVGNGSSFYFSLPTTNENE